MGRLLKTSAKKTKLNSCIFCGINYQKQKTIKTFLVDIEYVYIPPLDNSFHAVCSRCMSTLERYKEKYPHLWE
jgi:hypothetical protein